MARSARNVFVNCAFDETFKPVFDAMVFAIVRSGFEARSALEADDASENRFLKIQRIVEECRYGIHDISRIESDGDPPLPRFNMPLELGLFLGAKRYGDATQRRKRVLVFDTQRYRYQRFMSDLAGQDIHAHNNDPSTVIVEVTNWLRSSSKVSDRPGGRQIAAEYLEYQATLPGLLARMGLEASDVTFRDQVRIMAAYVEAI